MQNWRMHLKLKPVHSVLLLACLTMLVIAASVVLLLRDLRQRELEHSRLETMGLTEMAMRQVEQSFNSADLVMQGVQERLQTSYGSQIPLDSPQTHLLISTRAQALRSLGHFILIDAQGMVVNSSLPLGEVAAISASASAYFKAFLGDADPGLFIDKPVQSQQDKKWTVHLARRLAGPKNEFRGVVVAAMSITNMEQLFAFLKLDFERPISIYTSEGILVGGLPHRENLMGNLAPELNNESLPQIGGEVKLMHHESGDGATLVFSLGRLKTMPFLVSVTNDEAMSLASWRETAVPIAFGAAMGCLLIFAVAIFLVRELDREESLAIALHEAHDRYIHTVDSLMDAIVAVDEKQEIVLFNPAAERMFGLSAEQAMGVALTRLMPERLRTAHEAHVHQFADSSGASRSMAPKLDVMGVRSDGMEFPIESTISKTMIGGKLQLTAVLRDVSDRRKAELELRQMNQQLRELSAALQDVREQERARISRELHDDLGQQLTGLKLELAWLSSRLKEGRIAEPEKVTDMKRMLDVAIASVRRISTELRPLILDDLGFAEAVQWQVDEVAKRSGLKIEIDLPAHESVKNEAHATAMFRIVQESLTNIVRHAKASQVRISLVQEGEQLHLRIQDNGQGMTGPGRTGGIGLVSMRERVSALGGVFNWLSVPEQGVLVEVILPMHLEPQEGAAV